MAVATDATIPRMRNGVASIMRRAIPSTGELLAVIGLGTWRAFDVGGSATEREPRRQTLQRLIELDGTVVDSSPMYGRAEAVIGDLAGDLGVTGKLFLATKVWTTGRDAGIAQMEQSSQRLRARRIDLMQVHNLVDWRTHLPTLRDWKDAGRIRYLGVTHYTASAYDELERVLRREPMDFVQLNYSLEEPEAERRILPLAQERGVAVLVNRPFATGGLFQRARNRALPGWAAELGCRSWAQLFLKWILAHPAVTCVIPGTARPEHVADNLEAAAGRLPDGPARERMAAHVALAALLALVLLVTPPASGAQIYQWTDEAGNRHFTDNPYGVPEGYRAQPFRPRAPATDPAPTPPVSPSVPASPAPSPGASAEVKAGARLSAAEAMQLEQRVLANPADLGDRARLLGYYFSGSRNPAGPTASIEARRRHIIWLVANRPDAELAGLSEATIDPAGHVLADRAGYEQVRALWLEQVRRRPSEAAVLRHAAKFFMLPDKALAERVLRQGQRLEPQNPAWGDQLAYLRALGVMAIDGLNQNGLPTSIDAGQESGPFARASRQTLEASSRVSELLAAARVLTMYGSIVRGLRLTRQDHSVLAERLLKKAETLGAPRDQVAADLAQLYELRRQLSAAGK